MNADELSALGASCLGDAGGYAMTAAMRPAWSGATVVGPAFTVSAGAGDNLALHVACTEAPAGSVLVVDAGRAPEFGYWGEVLTTAAEARGLIGIVIEGGVRDIAEITEHEFPMFSTLVCHRGTTKTGARGSIGGTVEVGGVPVSPGDWVVADVDGVTVVPAERAADVLAAATAAALREAEVLEEIRSGETTVDLLGLDPGAIERR